tara:strand:- start:13998 stop:14834 length:837 start_codon:yes stop_codon:yes gene_type:complete
MKNTIYAIILLVALSSGLRAEGVSLADQRLVDIVERQNAIFEAIKTETGTPTPDQERLLHELVQSYESFLSDNPNSAYGAILFGKLLRQLDNPEEAAHLFLQANKLDPNIAVVKQQLGNYLAEKGDYILALPYFLSAIELEPNVGLYHYQLGELLSQYKSCFVQDGAFQAGEIDEKIMHAFAEAVRLSPQERSFAFRHAEAYYDLDTSNWPEALKTWDSLYKNAMSTAEKDIINFQRARIFIELDDKPSARQALSQVSSPILEQSCQELLASLPPENN